MAKSDCSVKSIGINRAFIFFVNDGLNKISGDTEGFGRPGRVLLPACRARTAPRSRRTGGYHVAGLDTHTVSGVSGFKGEKSFSGAGWPSAWSFRARHKVDFRPVLDKGKQLGRMKPCRQRNVRLGIKGPGGEVFGSFIGQAAVIARVVARVKLHDSALTDTKRALRTRYCAGMGARACSQASISCKRACDSRGWKGVVRQAVPPVRDHHHIRHAKRPGTSFSRRVDISPCTGPERLPAAGAPHPSP